MYDRKNNNNNGLLFSQVKAFIFVKYVKYFLYLATQHQIGNLHFPSACCILNFEKKTGKLNINALLIFYQCDKCDTCKKNENE